MSLVFSSLKSRWLNSSLSILLTVFGVVIAVIILQFGHHIHNRMTQDGKDIDIVLGAKGSPLQFILSSVYHIDIPTGNIQYSAAKRWMKHPKVKTAIPLALGDNWKGYRIVGTTPDYIAHYDGAFSEGRAWEKPFQIVVGADVPLKIGQEILGAHGLSHGGHVHDDEHYTVVGRLSQTGSVLDRLILTSVDSVLKIHGQDTNHLDQHDDHNHHKGHGHDHGNEQHHHDAHDHHDGHEKAKPAEITALLLTTRSPIANMNLPRLINRDTRLQAANPALEMARLTTLFGLGTKTFSALSALLIGVAALSIFAGLASSLENRMGDLAVLRAVGYSKKRVFKIIVTEGMFIVLMGLALGLVLGLYGFMIIAETFQPLATSSAQLNITHDLLWVIAAVILAGFMASALPALRASRVNVARQLTRAR